MSPSHRLPEGAAQTALTEHNASTLCANSEAKPWTLSGFRASWWPIRLRLEEAGKVQPALTLYGLRHTPAVVLREIGHDERATSAALGQRTIEMARHDTKGADLAPKLRALLATLDAEFARRSESQRHTDAGKVSIREVGHPTDANGNKELDGSEGGI